MEGMQKYRYHLIAAAVVAVVALIIAIVAIKGHGTQNERLSAVVVTSTTSAPTTVVTEVPTTPVPQTAAPTTAAPVTEPPTTQAPVTTAAPATTAPKAQAPATTAAPKTPATTAAPKPTSPPTTKAPVATGPTPAVNGASLASCTSGGDGYYHYVVTVAMNTANGYNTLQGTKSGSTITLTGRIGMTLPGYGPDAVAIKTTSGQVMELNFPGGPVYIDNGDCH